MCRTLTILTRIFLTILLVFFYKIINTHGEYRVLGGGEIDFKIVLHGYTILVFDTMLKEESIIWYNRKQQKTR